MSQEPTLSRRVLLKLSGELFKGKLSSGQQCPETMERFTREIAGALHRDCPAAIPEKLIQLAIVCGGGNYVRGSECTSGGTDRVTIDYIGMNATVFNAVALQDYFNRSGYGSKLRSHVMSAVACDSLCDQFVRRNALKCLEEGVITFCAGGIGAPFFTTDTTAVVRAAELKCQIVLKATDVEGIGREDPAVNPDTEIYREIKMSEILRLRLKVMDATAFTLAREQKMPIRVFNALTESNIAKAVRGEPIGTLVIPD